MTAHVGIPTLYRGVRFRSRTEARWAALFEALAWPWEYEPVDCVGYLPDFVIGWKRPLLVEVKGVSSLDEATYLAREKIEASGWEGEALIVGSSPLELSAAHPILGQHAGRERAPDGLSWLWDNGRVFGCLNCGSPSVLNCGGSWHCRACGEGEGNEHVGHIDIRSTWADCTNLTQWKAAS